MHRSVVPRGMLKSPQVARACIFGNSISPHYAVHREQRLHQTALVLEGLGGMLRKNPAVKRSRSHDTYCTRILHNVGSDSRMRKDRRWY